MPAKVSDPAMSINASSSLSPRRQHAPELSPPLSPLTSPELMALSDSDSNYCEFDDFRLDYDESFFSLFIGTPFRQSIESYKDRIREKISRKREALRTTVESRKLNLKMKLRQQKTVKLRDKFTFLLGVSSLWFVPSLMILRPQILPAFFTLVGLVLIAIRFLLYHSRKWHYFTADLCYIVNVATFALLYIFPNSRTLFISCFCLSNGPVAWAIYAWRNSMVFHSTDKMTSIWIHIMPALTMFCVRWMTPPEVTGYPLFSKSAISTDFSFLESLAVSMTMYLAWQALYYYFIIVLRAEKVLSGSRATSFTWMLADSLKNKPNSAVSRLMVRVGPRYQGALFMFLNFLFALVTSAPTILLYKNFHANALFLVGLISVSVFNGADFYIEVFSRRYRQELMLLDAAGEVDESLFEATFGCVGSRGKTFKDIVNETEEEEGQEEVAGVKVGGACQAGKKIV